MRLNEDQSIASFTKTAHTEPENEEADGAELSDVSADTAAGEAENFSEAETKTETETQSSDGFGEN